MKWKRGTWFMIGVNWGWFGMWGVRSNWPLPIGHTTFINRYKYLLKKI